MRIPSLLLLLICSFAVYSEENVNNKFDENYFFNLLYGDLKYIEKFHFIHVHVKGKPKDKDENKIGLSDEELTSYLKLRYKNNFANIPAGEYIYEPNLSDVEKRKLGNIWCGVWTVGQDYPVAYHVECRLGSEINKRIVHDEHLGYGNKDNVRKSIRESLNSMIENFAITFFKIRDEL